MGMGTSFLIGFMAMLGQCLITVAIARYVKHAYGALALVFAVAIGAIGCGYKLLPQRLFDHYWWPCIGFGAIFGMYACAFKQRRLSETCTNNSKATGATKDDIT